MIAILDFGSQYTQLIAKKLRSLGYSSEVYSGRLNFAELSKKSQNLKGIILSGSPLSVGSSFDPDEAYLNCGLPLLGICFGYQFLASRLGGEVAASTHREYGAASVKRSAQGRSDPLTKTLSDQTIVWMSHGDSVVKLPSGAQILLESAGKPAAFSIPDRKMWGLQFHPEVHHSPEGGRILKAFAEDVCKHAADWNMRSALEATRERLKESLKGVDEVLCAVSGGVDSTVLAVLLAEFVKVRAVFVDHGFLRSYDLRDLKKVFSKYPNISLEVLDAAPRFWSELKGVHDPEEKREIIGRLFIESFYGTLDKKFSSKSTNYLAQGTIYSDVIESAANELAPSEKIKSHHNVGGLPKDLPFTLVEPLRSYFKDEVREIGALLGIESDFLHRHPFPGPGLAIRCVGALYPDRIEILKRCDEILHDELIKRGLYEKTWQALCVLLPVSSVGVMGDGRSYESVVALRAVSSLDAMTAEASELPWNDLKAISSRLVNEVKGINRVVYDLTSKPPGTIEWE